MAARDATASRAFVSAERLGTSDTASVPQFRSRGQVRARTCAVLPDCRYPAGSWLLDGDRHRSWSGVVPRARFPECPATDEEFVRGGGPQGGAGTPTWAAVPAPADRLARVDRQCAGSPGFSRWCSAAGSRAASRCRCRGRPRLDLRLSFALDGLGALYALLATGVGALVFAYGTRYLTVHLEHEGRPAGERWRFWPWMVLFAVAMVGLATAQDLVLLFVFFDLTAVCSYFLIGFDRGRREARTAALMALLVTVVSAVAMLVAAVLLYAVHGTFSIPELIARAGPGPVTTTAAALLARRRAGQERAGSAALLAAPRDGGAHPRLGLPALGGDGGGRGARASRGCTRCWNAARRC